MKTKRKNRHLKGEKIGTLPEGTLKNTVVKCVVCLKGKFPGKEALISPFAKALFFTLED